jgi:hypothetical protein
MAQFISPFELLVLEPDCLVNENTSSQISRQLLLSVRCSGGNFPTSYLQLLAGFMATLNPTVIGIHPVAYNQKEAGWAEERPLTQNQPLTISYTSIRINHLSGISWV